MKRLLFSGLLLLSALSLSGQDNNLNTFHALTVRVLAIDHNLPNEDFDGLSTTFGLELGYRRQLGKLFGVAVPIKLGVIDVGELENPSIVGVEVLPQFYPLGTKTRLSPYLHTGYGVISEGFEDANHQIPLGGGVNFMLGDNSWFGFQAEYRISDQDQRDNVQIGLGYLYRLSSIDTDGDGIVNRRDACISDPGPAATNGCPDTDMDGLADAEDQCPNDAGPAILNGCPDGDGDGIPDAKDQCPETAGDANLNGCPDEDGDGVTDAQDLCPKHAGPQEFNGCPDTDGDGVSDYDDKCPDQKGDFLGCPDQDKDGVPDDLDDCPQRPGNLSSGCPDRDADGTADHEDKCPDEPGSFKGCPDSDEDGLADHVDDCPQEAGPTANGGCPTAVFTPEVNERLANIARSVEFETGSSRLKEASYVILSEVAGIMRQYPDYILRISGHTDNVGSDTNNLKLSEARALACRNFIIATGIPAGRVFSAGYGASRPKADNDTAFGRKLNRRVEFVLSEE